jgi:hypothetical protein
MNKAARQATWLEALQPRAMIFGFSLGMFVLTCVYDNHIHSLNNPPGYSHFAFNPENEVATFLLFIAAFGLLLRRWWSHLIAIVAGGRILYAPGYLSLWIFANVGPGGGSLLSFATWKNWYNFTVETQPQYILHALVGAIVCFYAAVALSCQIIRSNRTRANKALQLTAR